MVTCLAIVSARAWEHWGGDRRRDAVFKARPDHAGQCRQSRARLGISYRRSRKPSAARDGAHEIRGDAAVRRGQPDLLFALQRGDRARSRQRARRNGATIRRSPTSRASGQPLCLPRRRLLGRRPGGRRRRLPQPRFSWAPTTSASIALDAKTGIPCADFGDERRGQDRYRQGHCSGPANSRSPRRRW